MGYGLAIALGDGSSLDGSRFVSDIVNCCFGNDRCMAKGWPSQERKGGIAVLSSFCAKNSPKFQE